jgi:hypothetical protein
MTMSEFMSHTISDLRGGRESWRVLITITVPAFALAFAFTLVRLAQ